MCWLREKQHDSHIFHSFHGTQSFYLLNFCCISFQNICMSGCQFLSLILYSPVSTSICKFLILTLMKAPSKERMKKTAFPCNILVLNMDCYLTHLFVKRVIFVGYPSKEIYKSISSVSKNSHDDKFTGFFLHL